MHWPGSGPGPFDFSRLPTALFGRAALPGHPTELVGVQVVGTDEMTGPRPPCAQSGQAQSRGCSRRSGRTIRRTREAYRSAWPFLPNALKHCFRFPVSQVSLNSASLALTLIAPAPMPELAAALNDSNAHVRFVAILAVLELIQFDRQGYRIPPSLREPVQRMVPRLAQLVADPDPKVCVFAICILTRVGKSAKEAIPALIAALGDGRDGGGHTPMTVKASAARALGAMGAAAAVPQLQALLSDCDGSARDEAGRALKYIENDAHKTGTIDQSE